MATFEVFHVETIDAADYGFDGPGWYYWACFPGCLPDGEAYGPYRTREDLQADIREHHDTYGEADVIWP